MKNQLISIIIPVYNVELCLRKCLLSVLEQSYNNWEAIVVDDGSTDDSPQICDEFASKDQRFKIIHKENGGVAMARNVGLEIAKGEYITFLDSDDFLHQNFLSTLLELCVEHSADIAQCDHVRGKQTSFPEVLTKTSIECLDNHSVFLNGHSTIVVWGKIYRRKVLEGISMPVGKHFEDDFTTWKWYYNAKKIAVTTDVLYYYTDNNKSTMASHYLKPSLDFIDAYAERIDFFHNKGEKDLEDHTRAHLCKSMLLTSTNENLSKEQAKTVKKTFKDNWKAVNSSLYVPINLKALFIMYTISPHLIGLVVKKLYKA